MSAAIAQRAEWEAGRRRRLAALLERVRADNVFQRRRMKAVAFEVERDSPDRLPLTTRAELQQDQRENPPFGTNLTYPLDQYTHFHQTSGSAGDQPLRVLDSDADWDWWMGCWRTIFTFAGVERGDRIAFPFSFGPFIGFWSAFSGAQSLGCLCLPAGGMSTVARLRYMIENGATTVCCTPTYAMHMSDVAASEGIDLAGSSVRRLIVAGEPGGNIPAVRARIESAWGARVFDHAGMTEVGPWGVEHPSASGGLLVNEDEFIAEVIDPQSGAPAADGEPGELVLTNLGRIGWPVIRYRTGDLVRLTRASGAGESSGVDWAFCEGGVLGRADDMLTVRGNNVFPATIEGMLREVEGLSEFRLRIGRRGAALDELDIDVEPAPGVDGVRLAEQVARVIQDRLLFRPRVHAVAVDSLPRFELKARRVAYESR